jgi:4-diphosphocytidyl-2-C-methyl-D-erythritol kinase
MTSLRIEAPAKLNLSLAVTGRRSNGLHELAGAWALVDLADDLLLAPGGTGLRVETPDAAPSDPPLPVSPDRNLAWPGLVAGLGREPVDVCLTLAKRIPVAAGLGGGSSDAAAAWRLGRRWIGADDDAKPDELRRLALIGADVPFFAARRALAWVTGIGEQVANLDGATAGREVLLAHPAFGLITAEVFASLRKADWSGSAAEPSAQVGRNDLLAAARRLRPELDDLFRLVVAAGGEPHLSGSGPTSFVLSDDPDRIEAIAGRLMRAGVRVTRTRLRTEAASIEAMGEEQEAEA